MSKNKVKKNANKKTESSLIKDINQDTGEVKKFFIILFGVALVAVLLYFVSSKIIIKDGVSDKTETETKEETINYNKLDVGNVFNRPYKEYYVYVFASDANKASYYSSLTSVVDTKKHKIYMLDLKDELNKKAIGEKGNDKAKNPSELSLVEPTLIKIADGKIVKYIESLDDIEKELKSLKSSK